MPEKQDTNQSKEWLWKIKKRIFSKDALIFLVFFVLAGIFWFVQSLDRQRETHLRIPVDYVGVPEDIEIDSKLPKQIVVKVRDEGLTLLQYSRKKVAPLALDMKRGYFEKGQFVISSDQLKSRLSAYVRPTTAVLNITPDTILVRYHKLSKKTLPIRVKSAISYAPQYILSKDIQVSPTRVKVFGPQHVLDTMKAVYTEEVELRALADTTEVDAKLEKNKLGVKYAFDNVKVKVFVEMFTESKKELPITVINNPGNMHIRIFPPAVQASYNVGLSHFNKVKTGDIQLVFDYDEAKNSRRKRYKLQIINNSAFISNIRIHPEDVEFLLEEK